MSTVEITKENFSDHVEKPGIVFLDFWASWCGPCKNFAPIFEATADKNPDIIWGKIDTDKETEIAEGFGIRSIPTLMVFRDGILLYAQPGMVPAGKLEEIIVKVKELDMDKVREEMEHSSCSDESNCGEGNCGGGCCG